VGLEELEDAFFAGGVEFGGEVVEEEEWGFVGAGFHFFHFGEAERENGGADLALGAEVADGFAAEADGEVVAVGADFGVAAADVVFEVFAEEAEELGFGFVRGDGILGAEEVDVAEGEGFGGGGG